MSLQNGPARVVTATGVGATPQAAKEDAIRIALGQVLGEYVTAHFSMSNDRLTRDDVLSHSAGFIQEVRVLADQLRPDGLHEVTLTAQVATQAVEHWQPATGTTQPLSGDSLFAEAYSKLQRDRTALDLWRDLLVRFPARALIARVVGPPQVGIDARDPQDAKLRMAMQVEWQPGFLEDIRLLLEQTGTPLDIFQGPRDTPALCIPANHFGPRCYAIDRNLSTLIDRSLGVCWGPQVIPTVAVSVNGIKNDGSRIRLASTRLGTRLDSSNLISSNCMTTHLRKVTAHLEVVARVNVADLPRLSQLEAEIGKTRQKYGYLTEDL
ncbi:MAG: hypothetical protein ACREXM_20715 [Gammaproteobacteria bacterium]